MSKSRQVKRISEIIIHCAATPNGKSTYTVEDIDSWHSARGFNRDYYLRKYFNPELSSIGYHFVIGVDGSIHSGRALWETGAHARGHNTSGIGICMMGTDRFTAEQWVSLRSLVVGIQNVLGNPLEVYGHSELPNVHKTCPGFSVADWLFNNMMPDEVHLI